MVKSVISLYARLNLAKEAKLYKLFDHSLTLKFSHHNGIEYSIPKDKLERNYERKS